MIGIPEQIKLDDPYLDFAMAKTPARLAIRGHDGKPVIYRKARLKDEKTGKPTHVTVWLRVGSLDNCTLEDAPVAIRRHLLELQNLSLGGA